MDTVEIHRLLERENRRLNRMIFISESMRGLACASGGIGVIILIIRGLGAPLRDTIWIWLGFSLLGAAIGFIIGWIHRLNINDTARWLDRRLRTGEAFSAALTCLHRPSSGPFDAAIIERAKVLAGQVDQVQWPMLYLKRWSGLSLGALLAGMILVQISINLQRTHRITALPEAKRVQTILSSTTTALEKLPPTKPKEVAKAILARNPELARQMEEALRSGDTRLLEQLLQSAELYGNDRRVTVGDSSENSGKGQKFTGFNLPDNKNTGRNNKVNAGQVNADGNGERQFGTEKDSKRRGEKSQRDPREKTPSQSENNDEAKRSSTRNPSSNKNNEQNREGHQAGQDPGGKNKHWGDLNTNNPGKRVVLKETKDGPMFEYILPDKNISVPLSHVLPSSQRAAEASLNRRGVPGEYQEYVQAYFLALAKESANTAQSQGKE